MTSSRSRAAAAARRATRTPDAPASPGGAFSGGELSLAQVETCARVFDELERLPVFEDDERRARARVLCTFIDRVSAGDVAEDALALALLVAQRGAAWLGEHPGLLPLLTETWELPLIEAAVTWFNERTAREPSAPVAEEIVEDLLTLERVLAGGAVATGEAEDLSRAFLAYAHRWLRAHPRVLARYHARL